jgi:predicted neuraminidase
MVAQAALLCTALFGLAVHSQRIPDVMDGVIRPTADGRFVAAIPQGYKPGHHDPTREDGGQEHASFLMSLPSGELLVGWFSGQMEAQFEMNVVLSRLEVNSTQWEKPVVVSHRANYSNQNPLLFLDESTGWLHLYHPSQLVGAGQGNASVLSLVSKDGRGKIWSRPEEVLPKPGAFVRGRVMNSLDKKRLMMPMYFTPNGYSPQTKSDYCAVQISNVDRKNGIEWTEIDIKNSSGLAQPSMVRLNDSKTLKMFFRDRFCGWIYIATSTDEAQTWTKPKPSKLPNNNSGMMAYLLKSGAIVIVFNNAHLGRTPLSIALSYDGGETWPFIRPLESQPLPLNQNCTCGRGWSPPALKGTAPDFYHKNCQPTFAYPTVIQTDDEWIHVSYDHNRQVVWYQKMREDWIRGGV